LACWLFCYAVSGVYSVHKLSVPTFRVTAIKPTDSSGALHTHDDRGQICEWRRGKDGASHKRFGGRVGDAPQAWANGVEWESR
jgi:hypothetical protein